MKTILLALVCLVPIAAVPQGVGAYHYAHLTQATANNLIANAPVMVHTITVNASSSGTLVVVDTVKTDCSGGSAITGTTGSLTAGQTILLDIVTKNGLCITTGGTIDATVTYR